MVTNSDGSEVNITNDEIITFVDGTNSNDYKKPELSIDPETGYAIDPDTGALLDPHTFEPVDPTTSDLE